MVFDSIVIGHGPAGITASLYLKRANKNVLSIGKDQGILGSGKIVIENYYGHTAIKGEELASSSYEHAKKMGVELVNEEVLDISYEGELFKVTTNKNHFLGKTVLLATGAKRSKINIPGFKKYDGKGISYCVTCDGFFYKNKRVAIIGSTDYMIHELLDLRNITDDIIVFTNGEPLKEELKELVVREPIKEIIGNEEKVTSIATESNTYDIDGIFIAIGSPSALEFAKKLGVITNNNKVEVDERLETNIEGVFAAGDIIEGKMQVIKASYDGMMAADGIIDYLRNRKG
ncbi:NAD(P)/FAD-dependent oxidoreductase [Acholeplasma sp. OttesenSCG-928-E16]|nr:NAD(P)/FAD-dependent oxidoreductase [Acholeplasma sp. OttesenSCG-928-E16]